MDIIVSFVIQRTGVEIHNCRCESEHIKEFYNKGENVEIHGNAYHILDCIPSVNGSVVYKVYLNE